MPKCEWCGTEEKEECIRVVEYTAQFGICEKCLECIANKEWGKLSEILEQKKKRESNMTVRYKNGNTYSGIVRIALDLGRVIMVDVSGAVRATQWDAIAEIVESNHS